MLRASGERDWKPQRAIDAFVPKDQPRLRCQPLRAPVLMPNSVGVEPTFRTGDCQLGQ